ncbi:MAG: hypothetical protein ABSE39_11915 [Candidatus Bathyarchaeia archaeon]
MKRLLPLAAIEVFVWLILLLCTLLISKLAFSINLGNATIVQRVATQVARNMLSGVIVIMWLVIWKKLTDFYLWRTLTG